MKMMVMAAVFLSVPLGAGQQTSPAPRPVLENGELMALVIKPAYAELQAAMSAPAADNRARAVRYQQAARLAEFENLLLFRPGERTTSYEWQSLAAAARDQSARLADALVAALSSPGSPDPRDQYVAVSAACNACHQRFGRREAPTIAP